MNRFSTLYFAEKIKTLQLAERNARHVPLLADYANRVLYRYRTTIPVESYEPKTESYYRFRLCYTWESFHYVMKNRGPVTDSSEEVRLLEFIETVVEKCLLLIPWEERFQEEMALLWEHEEKRLLWAFMCDTLDAVERVGVSRVEECVKNVGIEEK
jgi:hypothetical protein